jgi:virginiamycin B lyase
MRRLKIARPSGFIVSAAFAVGACACSNTANGNAVPALTNAAPNASSTARFDNERVKISEFSDLPQYSGGYVPTQVTAASGALWVTDVIDQDFGENVVVRISTNGKSTATYYYGGVTSEGSSLDDIVAGPDGALWITDSYNGQILRMTTDGTYTAFPLTRGTPLSIVSGPDRALWFTIALTGASEIGRITTKGKITTYAAAGGAIDLAVGSDGALWFTELTANQIGRITTHGKFTTYSKGISSGAQPYSIAPGPDGALWFTERAGGRIGRITTTGKVTEYSSGITPSEAPNDLAAGPDGAMWFTEYETYNSYQVRDSKIGRITMSGKVNEYSKFDASSEPTGIAVGPDGNMWFVESKADRSGRVAL